MQNLNVAPERWTCKCSKCPFFYICITMTEISKFCQKIKGDFAFQIVFKLNEPREPCTQIQFFPNLIKKKLLLGWLIIFHLFRMVKGLLIFVQNLNCLAIVLNMHRRTWASFSTPIISWKQLLLFNAVLLISLPCRQKLSQAKALRSNSVVGVSFITATVCFYCHQDR